MSAAEKETMASIRELLFPLKPRRDGAIFDGFVPNLAADRFPLEELTVPTLILNLRDDHLAPYRFAVEAASRIPAAKLVSIDTGGHIFMGHDNDVREAIRRSFEQRPKCADPVQAPTVALDGQSSHPMPTISARLTARMNRYHGLK